MSALAVTHLPLLDSERRRPNQPKRVRVRSGDHQFFNDLGGLRLGYNTAKEKLGGIVFGAVMPEQFGPAGPAWTREQQLLERVLRDAIHEYHTYRTSETRRGKRLYQEARAWLLSREDQWLCSFLGICAALNLDADYVRAGIMKENKK